MNDKIRFAVRIVLILAAAGLVVLGLSFFNPFQTGVSSASAQEGDHDWRSDWAVDEGFALDIDTQGFSFPTAIAFIPNPGSGPKDPLYFVTELRGKVKVITQDRSVYTFAENFFQLVPEKELPEVEGETGLAGLCLAPEQGYVFVTFAYQDEQGILRNNIMRFDTQPQTFALEPSGQMAFTELFKPFEAAISHQIGSCQVAQNTLFVSVGDGRQTSQSQERNSLLGKVLHMTLDGQPAPDNPFIDAGNDEPSAPYVWGMGFRNPFGLKAVGDRLFVADNGSDIDRFVEVFPGENYLWDGTDWSIGARADVAISPDIGPVQVEYYPGGMAQIPEKYGHSFFVAASRPEMAGILRIAYNLEDQRPAGTPDFFVRYRGASEQILSGVALGPDGLYYAPLLPDPDGMSAIFKVTYAPEREHPNLLSITRDPVALMWDKGCFGCHMLDSEGGTAGPVLDRKPMTDRLKIKLSSAEYLQTLEEVDRLDREPFTSYREARQEILQAEDGERLRRWMIYHIIEPKFDNPYSAMPNLGLTKAEATLITDYLLRERSFTDQVKDVVLPWLPPVLMPRHLLFAFAIGLAGGTVGAALLYLITRAVRKRGSSR